MRKKQAIALLPLLAAISMSASALLAEPFEYITMISGEDLFSSQVSCVQVVGDALYLTDEQPVHATGSFRAIDIANLHQPKIMGYDQYPWYFGPFVVASGHAYVTHTFDFGGALSIYDISSPSTPTLRSRNVIASSKGMVYDLAVEGNLAYLAATDLGLRVLDVSDPTSATTKIEFDTEDLWAESVCLAPDRIYLTLRSAQAAANYLFILRRPTDADPGFRWLGLFSPLGSYPGQITHREGLLYLPDDDLKILDLADPLRPRTVGQIPVAGYMRVMAISGQVAFYPEGENDERILQAVDLSDPANARKIGSYPLGSRLLASAPVVRNGRDIFLPIKGEGIMVLRYTGPILSAAGREWGSYK